MCFILAPEDSNDLALKSRKSIAYILNDIQIFNA